MLSFCSTAQTYNYQTINPPIILQKGTNSTNDSNANYFTINGQDYPRGGYLRFGYAYNPASTYIPKPGDTITYAADSTVSIFYGINQMPLLQPVMDTMFRYGDSTNKVVRNMNGLRAWLRKYAY